MASKHKVCDDEKHCGYRLRISLCHNPCCHEHGTDAQLPDIFTVFMGFFLLCCFTLRRALPVLLFCYYYPVLNGRADVLKYRKKLFACIGYNLKLLCCIDQICKVHLGQFLDLALHLRRAVGTAEVFNDIYLFFYIIKCVVHRTAFYRIMVMALM